MARIKGVDIPNDKHVCISLTYIYGIGRSLAKEICEKAKVEPTKKAGDLTIEEQNALRDVINEHLVEGDLSIKKDFLFVDKEQIEMLVHVKEKVKLLLIRRSNRGRKENGI